MRDLNYESPHGRQLIRIPLLAHFPADSPACQLAVCDGEAEVGGRLAAMSGRPSTATDRSIHRYIIDVTIEHHPSPAGPAVGA